MIDLLEILSNYSYFGIFLLLLVIGTAPLLMPPSWMVLVSFQALDPSLNPFVLILVGATGTTIGRFFLKRISHLFRRFVGKEQKSNLDVIGNFLKRKRYGYILTSFLFAATPLPTNMLFVAYGLMRISSIGIYIGFWFGRVLSYYIMFSISDVVLVPFLELFDEPLTGIIIADIIGVGSLVLFASIDWSMLITQRKFKFVWPKIWRL
jgi:membrane protein YqaA with SNARE-associated domain